MERSSNTYSSECSNEEEDEEGNKKYVGQVQINLSTISKRLILI